MKDALVGNAGDKKQVEEAAGKERRGRMREIDDIKAILATPQGRRFLWRMMGFCGITESVFTGKNASTHYRAGKQDVGHFVLGEIVEAAPERYLEMMKENQKENE